jgi:hypothetical protein
VFLRQFSEASVENPKGLVTADDPFDRLLDLATPSRRAVLAALAGRLGLDGPDRLRQARAIAEQIGKDRRKIAERKTKLTAEYNRIKSRIRSRLKSRWPALVTAYHPGAQSILEREGERVQRFIESQDSFERWGQVGEQLADLEDEESALERKWVKCQRLIRCAESVALAANLGEVADEDVRKRYRDLVKAESGTLAATRQARPPLR